MAVGPYMENGFFLVGKKWFNRLLDELNNEQSKN